MRIMLGAAIGCALCSAAPAMAQSEQDQRARDIAGSVDRGVMNGLNDSPAKSSAGPELQLIANTDKQVASLSWTFKADDPGGPVENADGKWHFGYSEFTATVSGEFGDGAKETQLLGLGGFPGGTQVKLGYKRYWGSFYLPKPEDVKTALAIATAKCLVAPENATRADADDYCHAKLNSKETIIALYNPADRRRVYRPSTLFFLGADFDGSQDSYKFLDRATFATGKESKFSYGGSVFAGTVFPRGLAAVIVAFHYSHRYEAASSVTLCKPIAAPLSQCITAPDGPPTASKSAIVSIDLRKAFALPGKAAQFAIAPKFSYDVNDASYSVDVPLYLAGDGKGKLRGGVRGLYVNARDQTGVRKGDFSLALFVGVPFSIFN